MIKAAIRLIAKPVINKYLVHGVGTLKTLKEILENPYLFVVSKGKDDGTPIMSIYFPGLLK